MKLYLWTCVHEMFTALMGRISFYRYTHQHKINLKSVTLVSYTSDDWHHKTVYKTTKLSILYRKCAANTSEGQHVFIKTEKNHRQNKISFPKSMRNMRENATCSYRRRVLGKSHTMFTTDRILSWCTTIITDFNVQNVIIIQNCNRLENTFQKLYLLPSSSVGKETSALLGPLDSTDRG
jgi:hypothetical protein